MGTPLHPQFAMTDLEDAAVMHAAIEAIVEMKFSGMKACAASINFSSASPLSRGVTMLHANDSFNSKLVGLEELVGLSSHSTGAFSGCIRIPLELMVAVGDNTQVLVSSVPPA